MGATNMENQEIMSKIEIVKTEKLKALSATYRRVYQSRPDDRRKKEWKETETLMQAIEDEGKSLVADQAIGKLAIHGIIVKAPDLRIEGENGFVAFLKPLFRPSQYSSGDEFDARFLITYDRKQIADNQDNPVNEIKERFVEAQAEYDEAQALKRAQKSLSTLMFKLVNPKDITYKSRFEGEGGEWSGNEFSMETQEKDKWAESSRIRAQFSDVVDMDASIRTSFKTPEEAVAFWNDVKALVQKHTKQEVRAQINALLPRRSG